MNVFPPAESEIHAAVARKGQLFLKGNETNFCHEGWWWRSARNAIRFKMRKADWQNVIFDEKVWLLSLRSPENYKKKIT